MHTSHRRLPGELVFVLVMLLLGLTASWQAWRISGFASWSSPGAVPMMAAVVMVVSALLFVRDTLRVKGPDAGAAAPLSRQFFRQVTPSVIVWFTLLIVFYMLTLERLGFIVSSFVFLVAAMFALGSRRIWHTVLVSAVSLAVIYVIFQTAFSVVLPEGVLRGVFK